jgi:hypothetical protein
MLAFLCLFVAFFFGWLLRLSPQQQQYPSFYMLRVFFVCMLRILCYHVYSPSRSGDSPSSTRSIVVFAGDAIFSLARTSVCLFETLCYFRHFLFSFKHTTAFHMSSRKFFSGFFLHALCACCSYHVHHLLSFQVWRLTILDTWVLLLLLGVVIFFWQDAVFVRLTETLLAASRYLASSFK